MHATHCLDFLDSLLRRRPIWCLISITPECNCHTHFINDRGSTILRIFGSDRIPLIYDVNMALFYWRNNTKTRDYACSRHKHSIKKRYLIIEIWNSKLLYSYSCSSDPCGPRVPTHNGIFDLGYGWIPRIVLKADL